MSLTVYYFLIVLVACAATVLTRAFPFILFVKRPLPAFLRYLGRVLPSSIIVILLIYCVREQLFWKGNQSIASYLSLGAVFILHHRFRNMLLSISGATLLYMLLFHIMP